MITYLENHCCYPQPMIWDDLCFPFSASDLHAYVKAPHTYWAGFIQAFHW